MSNVARIGVISDTHIPERADNIPEEIFKVFKGVDLILHAGDLTELSVLSGLSKICEVRAVSGNMDSLQVTKKLPQKDIIKVGRFSIGLIHGSGHPAYLLEYIKTQFTQKLDAIVFGHSHQPFNQKEGGTLFFNPGSPTDKFFSPYNSCGILELSDTITAKIIKLGNKNHG